MSKYQALLLRFLKGAVAASIPVFVTALSGVTQFNNITELKQFLITIAVPVVTGLLLAFEKAINWVEPTQPVVIPQASEIQAAKKSRAKKSS
jgi:uncharacterized membrane protein